MARLDLRHRKSSRHLFNDFWTLSEPSECMNLWCIGLRIYICNTPPNILIHIENNLTLANQLNYTNIPDYSIFLHMAFLPSDYFQLKTVPFNWNLGETRNACFLGGYTIRYWTGGVFYGEIDYPISDRDDDSVSAHGIDRLGSVSRAYTQVSVKTSSF